MIVSLVVPLDSLDIDRAFFDEIDPRYARSFSAALPAVMDGYINCRLSPPGVPIDIFLVQTLEDLLTLMTDRWFDRRLTGIVRNLTQVMDEQIDEQLLDRFRRRELSDIPRIEIHATGLSVSWSPTVLQARHEHPYW